MTFPTARGAAPHPSLTRRPDRTREFDDEPRPRRPTSIYFSMKHLIGAEWRAIDGHDDGRGPMVRIVVFNREERRTIARAFIFPRTAAPYREVLRAAQDPKRTGRSAISVEVSPALTVNLWVQDSTSGPLIATGRKLESGQIVRPIFLTPAEFDGFGRALDWLDTDSRTATEAANRPQSEERHSK